MAEILIVEDQQMAMERMESMVQGEADFHVAGSLKNASHALAFCESNPVDLVLMDVYTENGESGLTAAAEIKQKFPKIKIVVVTSMAEHSFLERARAAGAESFWYKNLSSETLMSVVHRTLDGASIYPDRTPEVQIGLAGSYDFTERELDVLRLVVAGETDQAIALTLCVSVSAVRFHINNMLQKTGFGSRTKLAVAATNKGLIVTDV